MSKYKNFGISEMSGKLNKLTTIRDLINQYLKK